MAPAVHPLVEGYSEACIQIIPYFLCLNMVYNVFLEVQLSVATAMEPLYHLNQSSNGPDGQLCSTSLGDSEACIKIILYFGGPEIVYKL